ncbi:unnamed protein product [Gongylonema pulchrum]|uniref:HEAT repeat-containing protein 1 n=1 Tax=Gongylonema pulchrum TaxID=637853 RepID=A0A183ESL1_9BILA|nr:unnamed protein product [Gongylonema pulchrum]
MRLLVLFDRVLSLLANITSSDVINNMLSVLSPLLVVIESNPDRLVPLFEQFRRILVDTVDENISEKSLKRHCLGLLLKLVNNYIKCDKTQAGIILEFCLSMRDSLSAMQLASCMQVIAALSNLCVDFATQSNFLSNAAHDAINYLLQPGIQT